MDFRGTTEEPVTETLLPSCVSGSFAESFWFPPTTQWMVTYSLKSLFETEGGGVAWVRTIKQSSGAIKESSPYSM